MIDRNDVLLQSAPEELVVTLRAIDAQIAACQAAQQNAIAEYMAEQGWTIDTHNVNFDLASGMFTLTPISEAQPA